MFPQATVLNKKGSGATIQNAGRVFETSAIEQPTTNFGPANVSVVKYVVQKLYKNQYPAYAFSSLFTYFRCQLFYVTKKIGNLEITVSTLQIRAALQKFILSFSQNQEPVKISENQLNVFREVVDVTPDAEDLESESDNFRALQPLNERKLLEVYTGMR